jgi:hypothetical protein
MHLQALELREKVLGGAHPSRLTSFDNPVLVFNSQGMGGGSGDAPPGA